MNELSSTLRTWAHQDVVEDRRVTTLVGILAFVLATSFGAYVAVPLPWTPVPMTLQPLFVVLAGAVLGPWAGAAAMATYLAAGAGGAPVFSAGHAGIPWLMGPTGGYLLAYPAAAFAAGVLAGRSTHVFRLFGALAAGVALLYVGGVSQLFILTGESLPTLLALGVFPFLAGDLIKVFIGVWAARAARRHGSLGPR